MKQIWADPVYKINLICACAIQTLSSFNFYLITFDVKSFPGNIYVNSICFAFADLTAYVMSGVLLKFSNVTRGFLTSGITTMIASTVYVLVLP